MSERGEEPGVFQKEKGKENRLIWRQGSKCPITPYPNKGKEGKGEMKCSE